MEEPLRSPTKRYHPPPFRALVLFASRAFLVLSAALAAAAHADHIRCGVYLAPSSIPGAGLGMYVGNKTVAEGAVVTGEDVLVPIVERSWHSAPHLQEKRRFLWDEYIWNADVFPFTDGEIGWDLMEDMVMASPGVGSAANSYLSMVNVEDDVVRVGRAGLPRDSPGQGAFTIYHGRSFRAKRPMEPGQELFVDYGEEYFTSRERVYGFLPMPEDFRAADRILQAALNLTIRNDRIAAAADDEDDSDKDDDETRVMVWEDLYGLMQEISTNLVDGKSRVLNAFPSDLFAVEDLLENGGTGRQDHNRSIRDLGWLEKHGQCADNINAGTSTIPDAGRGAFATRFIPSGGLVSPAPLVHVEDLDTMAMFTEHIYNEDDKLVPNRSGNYTWQLMINYCFAHEQSTLLLCPYGLLSSLINHSPGKNANTRIQWSEKHRMRHPEWLGQPIEKWVGEYHTGLQIDFVATRDIEEGEEVLIDYGPLWQAAWDKHTAAFEFRKHRSEHYLPSYELNELLLAEEGDSSVPLRTEDDRDYRLDGVQLYCHGWYVARHGIGTRKMDEKTPMCSIIRKFDGDSYLVRIIDWYNDEDDRTTKYEEDGTVWGLPRRAFVFDDLPYFRDIHQEWTFRHPMIIPNDMFPKVWKNANYASEDREFLEYVDKADGMEEHEDFDDEEEENDDYDYDETFDDDYDDGDDGQQELPS